MNKPTSLPTGWPIWLVVTLAVYVVIQLCTRPAVYVDSMNYAFNIVTYYHSAVPPRENPVWDFGHALWRPAALAIWAVFHGPLTILFPGEEVVSAVYAFIVLSAIGGIAGSVLLFLTIARVAGRAWVAGVATMGFVGTAVVMNYTLTGTAYMAGGACQISGLYLLSRAIQDRRPTAIRGFAAGLLLGISVCIWFPYVLAMGGYLCFALLWPKGADPASLRSRFPFSAGMLAGIGVVVVVVYAAVMAKAGVTSFETARQWMERSRYGIAPTRGLLRVAAGLPRSFLWLGDAGSTWKRALLGSGDGPGAAALLRSGIWKLVLVYTVLGFSFWRLWRMPRGRILLVCVAAAGVPLVLFAAILFDPSALERYYAAFPLLFLAFAVMLTEDRQPRLSRTVLPAFFAILLVTNGLAMARFNGDGEFGNAAARLSSLAGKTGPNDVILLMSVKDNANEFIEARPFAPQSRVRYLLHIVLPQGSIRALTWKKDSANKILDAWRRNGRAWLSLRLLAGQPATEWKWVEGDDVRIHWADAPPFFRRLQLGDPIGGADGFAEVVHSPSNEQMLRATSEAP